MRPQLIQPRMIWLLLPPIALCCLDFGLTLYGQSDSYWSGRYGNVNELSPSFGRYLSIHPLVFIAAGLVWIAIFSAVIAIVPGTIAMTLSVCVVIGHMTGAASWLAYRFDSYQSCNALFLATAIVIVVAFKNARSEGSRSMIDWSRTGLPSWTRWLTVAILIALPVWWFLIPR